MQKFILITLIIGLGFFLYLLQAGYISKEDFNIEKFKGDTEFVIRKNTENNTDSSTQTSDIYAIIKGKEYKIFSFSGNDFKVLFKYEFADTKYKVPVNATDAIAGTWIGNRYVFYILPSIDFETKKTIYEIYEAEYPTDDISKLTYIKIKSISDDEFNNKVEIKY